MEEGWDSERAVVPPATRARHTTRAAHLAAPPAVAMPPHNPAVPTCAVAEALYSNEYKDAATLAATACGSWSNSCRRRPPKLDPNRPRGPPFVAYTDEQRAAAEPPRPGMLSEAQLRYSLGLDDSEDDSGGAQSSGGPDGMNAVHNGLEPGIAADLSHTGAFVPADVGGGASDSDSDGGGEV